MALRANTTETPTQSATINIASRSALEVAPEAMFFDVTLTGFDTAGPGAGEVYDARLHEVYYKWDFYASGSPSGDQSYVYSTPNKIPSQFRNSRYAFGPSVSHTFRTPGTYRVQCTINEPASGKSAVATRDVIIGNADTVFTADNQTIIVDDQNRVYAPYPSATRVTTFDAAKNAIIAFGDQTTPRRVILRRGQTFTSTGWNIGPDSGNWPSTHWLAADEAGADPIVDTAATIEWNNGGGTGAKDYIWQNIEFVGEWDPVTETGTKHNGITINTAPPQQVLLDGVTLRDFMRGFYLLDVNTTTYNVALNDCYIDGWQDYGMYVANLNRLALTGTKIEQDPLANAGGSRAGDPVNNNHGPLRIASPDSSSVTTIHSSEFYSRNSWFATGGIYEQQPCTRFDTGGVGGATILMHCNVFEGGQDILTFGVQSTATGRMINGLVAQNYLMATHSSTEGIAISKSGMTFRNNIIAVPDTPIYSGLTFNRFTKTPWDGKDTTNRDGPIRIYNNTMINLMATAAPETTDPTSFTDVKCVNNLVYEPNLGTPNTADGPITSTQLFTPTEPGYKENVSYGTGRHTLQTAYATAAADVWAGVIQAGAGAESDASSAGGNPVAFDDFWGNERPSPASRGATEPA